MPLIVSHYGQPGFCDKGIKAELLPGLHCVVGFDRNYLGVWNLTNEKPFLELATRIPIDDRRFAPIVTTARHNDRDLVILSYSEELLLFTFSDMWSYKVFTIPINYIEGFCMTRDPVLHTYVFRGMSYLVIFHQGGFLTLVNITLCLEPAKGDTAEKRRKATRRYRTVNVGDLTLQLMSVIGKGSNILAALVRDIDYYYRLRFYELLMEAETLPILFETNTFQDAPTHVYSHSDGAVVLSDTKAWFHAHPTNSLTVSKSAGDSSFPVTQNSPKTAVLDLSALSSRFLGSPVRCSTRIDEKRQLIINSEGETFIIYLDVTSESTNVEIVEFKVVYLNKSTDASSVTLLDGNVFLASSNYSQSLIFRVLQQAPFIDILLTISDHLSIMKIDTIPKSYSSDFLIGRNREISHISTSEYVAKPKISVAVSLDADRLSLTDDSSSIQLFAGNCFIENLSSSSLVVDLNVVSTISDSKDSDYEKVWSFGDTVFKLKRLQSLVLLSTLCVKKVVLTGMDEVSDLSYNKDSRTVHITLWNGFFLTIKFNDGTFTLFEERLPFEGHSSIACVNYDSEKYLVVVVHEDGRVFQKFFENDEYVGSNLICAKREESLFRISGARAGEKTALYIFGKRNVFRMTQIKQTYFLEPHHVLETEIEILDCKILLKPEGEELAILFVNGILSTFAIVNEAPLISYYPKRSLNTFVKLGDDFVIALEYKSTPNQATGKIDVLNYLVLLDQQTLQVLDTYMAPAGDHYTDLCVLDSKTPKKDEYIVIVGNHCSSSLRKLPYFVIQNKQISSPQYFEVSAKGLKDGFSIETIFSSNGRVFLLGFLVVEAILVTNKLGTKHWQILSVVNDIMGQAISGNSKFTAIADCSMGILVSKEGNHDYEMLSFSMDFTPFDSNNFTMVTEIVLLKSKPVLIYGCGTGRVGGCTLDSEGSIIDPKDPDNVLSFSFTLDCPVKSICVVQESPLCLLIGATTGQIYKAQEVEEKYTPLLQEVLNQAPTSSQCQRTILRQNTAYTRVEPLNAFDSGILSGSEGLSELQKKKLALVLFDSNVSY